MSGFKKFKNKVKSLYNKSKSKLLQGKAHLKRSYNESELLHMASEVTGPLGRAISSALEVDESLARDLYFDSKRELKVAISDNIDKSIRKSIRGMGGPKNYSEFDTKEAYKDRLFAGINRKFHTSLDHFLKYCEKNYSSLIDDKKFNVDLTISINESLKNLAFKTDNFDCKIRKPRLLWDCNCPEPKGSYPIEVWDSEQRGAFCPIHDGCQTYGDELEAKFKNGLVEIEYKGVSVLWYRVHDFWPPSVDSMHLFENLRSSGFINDVRPKSVLDLGSGTGFLGILIANEYKFLEELFLSDWLLTPFLFGCINWSKNNKNLQHIDFYPLLGIGLDFLNRKPSLEKKFDLCISNPPYLPDLGEFQEIRAKDTVAGTDLLEEIIERGFDHANEIVLSFSEIALDEAKIAANNVNVELVPIGETHEVPFRVPYVHDNKEYMQNLEKKGLKVKQNTRYPYWHDVTTYRLKK